MSKACSLFTNVSSVKSWKLSSLHISSILGDGATNNDLWIDLFLSVILGGSLSSIKGYKLKFSSEMYCFFGGFLWTGFRTVSRQTLKLNVDP